MNRKDQNFTSSDIQDDILKEMSLSILRVIVDSIKNAGFHSIMVNETSNLSDKEQAVFCDRGVDENLFFI